MISLFDNLIYRLSIGDNASRHDYTMFRKFLKFLANMVLPCYLWMQLKFVKKEKSESVDNTKFIVSLTSFPKRIKKAWICIASILLQKVSPDRVVLWLSSDEFSTLEDLPQSLLRLQKYGLEIKFCPGNKFGHKKYFYIEEDMKECIFITVDDDVIYRNDLLENLLKTFNNNKNSVCATVAHKVLLNNKSTLPYTTWPAAQDLESGNLVFPVGAGAVLYPPYFFKNFLFESETINEICLYADDIWLFAVARYLGFHSVKSNYSSSYLPILYSNNSTLFQTNVGSGKNDTQMVDVTRYFLEVKKFDLIEKLAS